jgi:hypothetical protein
VSWFLFCAVVVPAQNDDVVTDTVITTMHLPKEERISRGVFDTASQQLPIKVRSVPQRLIDSLQAADDFWYASMERKKPKPLAQQEPSSGRRIFQYRWFRNLLWIIILTSFCGVVLWYLISSNILLFRKKVKAFGSTDDTEEGGDNIFERDYEKELAEATTAGNFRLAIRLLYLRTLKSLSDNGVIDYRFGRTNQDYVSDMRNHPQYHAFFRLTRHFEYIWYGQFPLSAEAYHNLQADFIKFKNSLPA